MRRSSSSVRPRRRVPAIGREMTRAVEQLHHRLRRRADQRHARLAHEVHVRARVHLAEHPVDVEGVGVEVEVEALRRARPGRCRRRGCAPWPPPPPGRTPSAPIVERTSGSGSSGSGGSTSGSSSGRAPSAAELVDAARRPRRSARRARRRTRPGSTSTFSMSVHPLAPVVVGGQLADDRHHGVGVAQVVGGHVGQVLDLADDVVAEVAHDPAVQRRQVVERAGPSRRRARCSMAARMPRSSGTPAGSVPVASTSRPRATRVASGLRPMNDQRLQRSPCSTDSSRKPGSSPTSAEEGGDRRGEVGQHLAPHRDDGVLAGQGAELLARSGRRVTRRPGRSRSARRCGTRPCPPARRRTAGCRRRSRRRPGGRTGGRRDVSPLRHTSCRLRDQNTVRPSSRLMPQRLGVHPRHHQHVAGALLLHDGRHEAVGVVLHEGELLVGGGDRGGDGHAAIVRATPTRSVNGFVRLADLCVHRTGGS